MSRNHERVSRRQMGNKQRLNPSLLSGIEEEIQAAHTLSGWARLMELLPFIFLYAIGAILAHQSEFTSWAKIIGIILMGISLNSLGILIHEGLHGILAQNQHFNAVLSFLCGIPLLISSTAYRVTHTDHHYEFGRRLDYGTYKQHLSKPALIWIAYLCQLCMGAVIYVLLIPILGLRNGSVIERCYIIRDYCLLFSIVTIVFVAFSLDSIALHWLYPSIVVVVLSNIRGLASHALGDLDDIFLSSRTITSSPIVSHLLLHENYHLEHHLFPQVPSYHLKKLHNLVWNRLPRALYAKSYRDFFIDFAKAAAYLDLEPVGQVFPSKTKIALSSK